MDSEQPGMGGRPVLNLPPSAASATAIAGVSSAVQKILRKIIAEALQKTALFLTH